MYEIPHTPSPTAAINELSDFAEFECWQRQRVSERDLIAALGKMDDNDINDGCEDADDKNSDSLSEVMNEIERRNEACPNGYPFLLESGGTVLRFQANAFANCNAPSIVYLYLLLATRLNMKDNRQHAGLDGTKLMEQLSTEALRNYLGSTRARATVFGTSAGGQGFQGKVDALCRDLCEGEQFRQLTSGRMTARDGKLDTVGWIPFEDALPGQLIIFGQCKTGTHWQDALTHLQPDSFITKWIKIPFLAPPVRAFFIAEAPNRLSWENTVSDAGILFDRCRLVSLCDEISVGLLSDIKTWTTAAYQSA